MRVVGDITLENGKQMNESVATESAKRGLDLVLMDMVQALPLKRDTDRFLLGEHTVSVLRPGLKIASVLPQQVINKVHENTIVNRGGETLITGDKEQAIAWLLED